MRADELLAEVDRQVVAATLLTSTSLQKLPTASSSVG
jgi:hypothetical protein